MLITAAISLMSYFASVARQKNKYISHENICKNVPIWSFPFKAHFLKQMSGVSTQATHYFVLGN